MVLRRGALKRVRPPMHFLLGYVAHVKHSTCGEILTKCCHCSLKSENYDFKSLNNLLPVNFIVHYSTCF